ncbi:MAG: GntR family transcriptional regulator [Xanthomonadales bacterium]|nr:GntR family transcriptional regulator [Xanthomonadales bacterium]
MVADVLRTRILGGELADGDLLPKQEELLEEFEVSKPSIREALRILETERLITVQRGNVGGAVVHRPKPENAAYTLGLVLQSRTVALGDVGAALGHLEPICASLCAEREDRDTTVVPRLDALNDEAEAALDEEVAFTHHARRFHEELVASCGNETMILVIGALESLWSAHEQEWAERVSDEGTFPDAKYRKTSLKAHQRLARLIRSGDADAAARAARAHFADSLFPEVSGDDGVRASSLR